MDNEIQSLEQLYKRVYPALTSKKRELIKSGYEYIKQKDIWEYLSNEKWRNTEGLDISTMVSDIFNADNEKIDKFLKDILKKRSEADE